MSVHLCPEQSRDCGDFPVFWCHSCPQWQTIPIGEWQEAPAGQEAQPVAPMLDDEGRAMVGASHHYTAENIAAIVADLKALEAGDDDAWDRQQNRDVRTHAGVLWRVIAGLAHDVPLASPPQAPAAVQGDETEQRLRDALELMWDRYENGDPCHDSDDPAEGCFIGNAVRLFEDEESEILSLIPSTPAKPTRAFPISLLASPPPRQAFGMTAKEVGWPT